MNKYIIHTFDTFGPSDQAFGAHFGDYDEGVMVGTGPTEEAAIIDLVTNHDLVSA